ncbi:SCO family protein [Robertmurraya sp. DFI.2.37]|uniref:SCO family protein n=1 Tax=Robertmurraya sp. DFI.2.37 TaxID=3031819 RepID=UPI001243E023|nr:SCO family protein [Robertmurraya sp. DFI.2.37]MDF1509821.1 SCO family protein [Robertmurraya sp. DFI.2.37]
MKKIYILCGVIVALAITAGISFFLIRDSMAKIPENIDLITTNNEVYKFSESEKKLKLVEFMYTNCPDICPTTTLKMNMLKKDLQDAGVFGEKVQFMTITIDPYKDTPEVLQQYMYNFDVEDDGNWIFLTGDQNNIKEDLKEIEELANTFQFQYRDPGDGFFIHSTFVYLLDENNRYIKKYPMGEEFNREDIFKKIMQKVN